MGLTLIKRSVEEIGDHFRKDADVPDAVEYWLSRRLQGASPAKTNQELIDRLEFILLYHERTQARKLATARINQVIETIALERAERGLT